VDSVVRRDAKRIGQMLHAIATYVVMVAALWGIFVYVPTEKAQGIVQRIFYFHVSAAATMFLAFGVVFVASIVYLWKNLPWWDHLAASAAELGVMFCTLVLITGPIWGRPIWGAWWTWDPTLTLTLVLWLIYVAYLMLRTHAYDQRRARFAAILGIIGFIDVPLIRWSVEKWRTLHPKPVVLQEGGSTGLPPSMLLTFLVSLVAFWLVFFLLLRERLALAQRHADLEGIRQTIDQELAD
jgi:heme exporter protein C